MIRSDPEGIAMPASPEHRTAPSVLGSSLTLPNGTVLPNRLAKSAMSECLGNLDNAPTSRLATLYSRWSTSGAGLLITGNIMVDRHGVAEVGNVVVDDDRDLPELQAWATSAQSHGAHLWAQINHPGRQVPLVMSTRPVAPSAIKMVGSAGLFRTPRELTGTEIERIIGRFATSARVLVAAGFGGIQVHAAHGYLISQFLSPLTNCRTDGWGGTPEKRRRFLLEVVRAVRAEIGGAVALGVKLNSADFQRGGFDEDESADVVRALNAEGIDLLEISGGTYESTAFMGSSVSLKASTVAREAYFLDFAQKIRGDLSVPLMLTGGFRSARGMAAAVDSGAVDIVGLARPLVLEPDLPTRLLNATATASTARQRKLGIKQIDGFTDLMWNNTQLARMGNGKDPAPNLNPLVAVAAYSSHMVPHTMKRLSRVLQ